EARTAHHTATCIARTNDPLRNGRKACRVEPCESLCRTSVARRVIGLRIADQVGSRRGHRARGNNPLAGWIYAGGRYRERRPRVGREDAGKFPSPQRVANDIVTVPENRNR